MTENLDIVCFGSAIVDIFLQSDSFKLIEKDETTFVCKKYGEKIEVSQRVICTGGGGTNTAVSFSRQGLKAGLACRFGSDLFGQFIVNQLQREGVQSDFLVQKEEETDTSVILVGPDGGRTILVCRGDTRLEEKNIDWDKLKAKRFYITSLEGNIHLAEKIIEFGHQKAIKVSWNPGKKELQNKQKVKQLAAKVEIFNLNRTEMEELIETNIDDQSFWHQVANLNVPLTIVTNGRLGAYLLDKNEMHFMPADEVDPVDETGAGDAFGSGFVAGLIKGMDKKQAFGFAIKNAASVVQYFGAKKGLLRNSKVQNFNAQS